MPVSPFRSLLASPVQFVEAMAPALALVRRRAAMLGLWEVLPAQATLLLVAGDVITALALDLDFTPVQLGILVVLPAAAPILHPLGAYAVERLGRKKPLYLALTLAARLAFFLPILLSAELAPYARRPLIFGGLLAANALHAMALNAWQAWIGDLTDGMQRGRYFGARNALMSVANLVVGPLAFRYLGEEPTAADFHAVFLVALATSCCSFALMSATPEVPPPPRPDPVRFRREALRPFADPNFRRLIGFMVVFFFGVHLAAPFWLKYLREVMDLSFATIAWFSITGQCCAIFGFGYWGRVADRIGMKPVIMTSIRGAGLTPLFWLFLHTASWPLMFLEAASSGFFWPGFIAQSFNLILASAPVAGRSMFLAMVSACGGLAALLGGWLGGLVMERLAGLSAHWQFGASTFIFREHHVVFLLSMVLRFASLLILRRFREEQLSGAPEA